MGIETAIQADIISTHRYSNSPIKEIAIPGANIRMESFDVNVRPNKKSFQENIKTYIEAARIPGKLTGKIIRARVTIFPDPSM